MSALLMSAVILGPGGGQRGAALDFPAQGDDTTYSMGVFRIVVDPIFRTLLEPGGPNVTYPGYSLADFKVTSPLCIDSATTIGRSGPSIRPRIFPTPIGLGSWDSVSGYGAYPATPFTWLFPMPNTAEVLTEIKSFVLSSASSSAGQRECPPDPRVPPVPINWPMVKSGTFAGVMPRSLGMVHENMPNGVGASDFPAHSFFDIFVEVSLPPIPGTKSGTLFPAGGALLTNGTPLIITNLALDNFPPTVVYIHGETTAVPLKFKQPNPPYWAAGEVFGWLVLAGHGTSSNDCSNPGAVTALLDAALGPIGTSAPEMPVEWTRTNTLCPSPGTTYESVKDIDIIQFPVPGFGAVSVRNFVHGNLVNPILPPPVGGTAFYNANGTMVTAELSTDGQTWQGAQAFGPVQVRIRNTSGTGGTSTFDTEMLQLNLSGNGPLGPFMLRESPTRQSLGRHTIRPNGSNFEISSFFDVFLELQNPADPTGQTWIPADRAVRVLPSAPPAAPHTIFIKQDGTSLALDWLGEFQLEAATSVQGPYQIVPGATSGPFRTTAGGNERYFKLRK